MMHALTRMQPIAVVPNAEIYAPMETLIAKALVPSDEDAVLLLLQRAERSVAHLAKNFDAWMGAESDRLLRAHGRYALDPRDDEARGQLYRAAHDIRANAVSFGFPMAARMATSLVHLLDGADQPPELLVKRHVAAIRAVVREDVRDKSRSAITVAMELERMVRETIAFGPL
jgi:chemotaxis protein histidine kinase CheA